MLSAEENARYSKQIILPEIGIDGQEKLRNAKVLVIGAGGLGCPILQYLTAAGVGAIGVADGDAIHISNLQRQVLYTESDIGQNKAEIAISKLKLLNPLVAFHLHKFFITGDNALEILKDYEVVVDGSDNFATRYLVNDACVILNIPLVFGAIYKFEGHVSVFNYMNGPTYRCIFPEQPGFDEAPNCADIGVIATLPGIIGTMQANEAVKVITGIGNTLSGKLLVIDTLTMHMHTFSFKLNEANKNITELQQTSIYCEASVKNIDYSQLQVMQQNTNTQLVDVRETEEHQIENIGGINIPLSVFDASYHLLNPDNNIVLYCSSGTRSNHAAKQLIQNGFAHIFHLQGGINAIIKH
ncbi:MAG: dinucleotide-utilizing protein [Flavipsychrobacter sp.]|jgi:adenylyltransferase/sulfurtransferase|nr:dinucleotide-utilizing protein [Flavipsychrobacter sp.]